MPQAKKQTTAQRLRKLEEEVKEMAQVVAFLLHGNERLNEVVATLLVQSQGFASLQEWLDSEVTASGTLEPPTPVSPEEEEAHRAELQKHYGQGHY